MIAILFLSALLGAAAVVTVARVGEKSGIVDYSGQDPDRG